MLTYVVIFQISYIILSIIANSEERSLMDMLTEQLPQGEIKHLVKREGFGPWEAQDSWDEKGKSNIAPTFQATVNKMLEIEQEIQHDFSIIANYTQTFVASIAHPLMNIKSWLTAGAIIAAVIAVIYLSYYFVRILWSLIIMVVSFVGFFTDKLFNSLCLAKCCALAPFIFVRNHFISLWRWIKGRYSLKVYRKKEREEISMVKTSTSKLYTDDKGVYMLAGENHKVYFVKSDDGVLEILPLLSDFNRDKEVAIPMKETVISTSKFYKVDKFPKFIGEFEVDGKRIGYFSRINYEGKDCLITAFHVLHYNKMANISLRKGDKSIAFNTVLNSVLAMSPTDDLDFIILQVPTYVFSILGVAQGKINNRVQARETINIYQEYDGKPCVTMSTIHLHEEKQWFIKYSASTLVGTSGAPVLDCRNRIVGIHIESDSTLKCNVGVIPPIFRKALKESPTNEDLVSGLPEWEEVAEENDERDYEEDDRYDQIARDIERYRMFLKKKEDDLKYGAWAEAVALYDEGEEELFGKYGDSWTKYKASRGNMVGAYSEDILDARGRHVGDMIKRGRQRKESPWTCTKCLLVQDSSDSKFHCKSCGFAVKPLTRSHIKKLENKAKLAAPLLNQTLPTEIVNKITKEIDEEAFAQKVALIVMKLIENNIACKDPVKWVPQPNVKKTLYPNISHDKIPTAPLPETPVDVSLVGHQDWLNPIIESDANFYSTDKARINHTNYEFVDGPTKSTKEFNSIYGTKHAEVLDLKFPLKISYADNISDPKLEKVAQVIKETQVVKENVEVKKKSRNRKRKHNKAKETDVANTEEASAVPLNSSAPAPAGETTLSGLSQSDSQKNPQLSDIAKLISQVEALSAIVHDGKKHVRSTQSSTLTSGQKGVPKRKNKVSHSNATITSKNTVNQQPKN
jgi:hypothetical protein